MDYASWALAILGIAAVIWKGGRIEQKVDDAVKGVVELSERFDKANIPEMDKDIAIIKERCEQRYQTVMDTMKLVKQKTNQ